MKEITEALKKDKDNRATDILNIVLKMVGRGDSKETIFEVTQMLKTFDGSLYEAPEAFKYSGGSI